MRRPASLDYPPIVRLEDGSLLFGERAHGIVDDETQTQRHERCVNTDRARIAREAHRMNAQFGIIALHPIHGGAVRGEAMLNEDILAHAHPVGAIPHGLDCGGDEIRVNGTLEALLQRNGLIVVVVLAAGVGEAQARSLRPLEFGGASSKCYP